MVGLRIVRIKFDGAFVFFLGARPIPDESENRESQRTVSLGKRLINLQCLYGFCLCLWKKFGGTPAKPMVRPRQLGMSQTIIRLYFDRLLQIFEALSQ